MNDNRSDIVITGFSGRFPEADNVEEFKRNLFDEVDMVTENDRRWPPGLMGLPGRHGKLKDLESFDAAFFSIHAKLADEMDPELRIILEVTHEAIIDAGINPTELRGSKTGVFIAATMPDSKDYSADSYKVTGREILSHARFMLANRISYSFDFKGPSLVLDTACSSSLYALHHAILAMQVGECDSAIVGGVLINYNPYVNLGFQRAQMLSPEGMCKSFDADANGYVRSEAVAVIVLQRSFDARRIYASIANLKTSCDGYKDQGITHPSEENQRDLLRKVYEEAAIDPREISYLEAHGTGTKAGDPEELNAIAEVFCKNRSAPLLIGSVKSNMGHSEPASGICSIIKVLISMVNRSLPSNLHFKSPNPDIPALTGKLKVVDKKTAWEGGLVGINSFGVGGTNAHAILKSFDKKKPPTIHTELPKLIGVSGRTHEACQMLLENVEKHKQDDEFVGLIQNIYKKSIRGYNYRGFSILGDDVIQEIYKAESSDKRPVWYIFPGMGSQWPKCGRELMKIPAFAESIKRSATYVKQFGLDLVNLIDNSAETDFEDVIKSFVLITSIQVGLVDLLTTLGIQADGIIGISAGEMACAYADGSLSQEQTILSSYWRGKCILESEIIDGEMAVIGLSLEEIKKVCPEDIDIAIHIAVDLVTISGPKKSVNKFIGELSAKGIRATPFNSSGIPFHSRYIAKTGEKLKLRMDTIIPHPKKRSSKWISSSVQVTCFDTEMDRNCNGDYFVHNLLQPVYFFEKLKFIQKNAIIIEISPHGGLKTVFSKSLPPTVLNLALHKKLHSNNLIFLLMNLGKLFNAGMEVDFSKLYPPIEFPVGFQTPMLNSLVRWDHSQKWAVAKYSKNNQNRGQTVVNLDISQEEFKFLSGHQLAGKIVFPATGYIFLVWKTFANIIGAQMEQLPVVLENIKILQAIILPNEGSVNLVINIFNGTGDFEICEGNSLIASGRIFMPGSSEKFQLVLPEPQDSTEDFLSLTNEDCYKELRLRGYEYSGEFKGFKSSNNIISKGELLWKNNWVTFIDSMIQFNILTKYETKNFYLPSKIQYLSIDPQKHLSMKNDLNIYIVKNFPDLKVVQSGGIELRDIKYTLTKRQLNQAPPKLENYCFVPYDNCETSDSDPNESQFQALSVFFQIMRDNLQVTKLCGVEVCSNVDSLIARTVVEILLNEPLLTYDFGVTSTLLTDSYLSTLQQFNIRTVNKEISVSPVGHGLHFVIAENVLSKKNATVLSNLISSIKPEGFILLTETESFDSAFIKNFGLIIASKQKTANKFFILLKKQQEKYYPIVVNVTEKNFLWLPDLKSALKKSEQTGDKILLVSQGEPELGILGLMNCIHRESEVGINVSILFIQDASAPPFSMENTFYSAQLEKQLISNVFKNNKWGSYRHIWVKNDKLSLSKKTIHAYVNTLNQGDLSSLHWVKGPLEYEKCDKNSVKEIFEVYYAPLNFRDIMLATGKLSPDALPKNLREEECILGLEFAGKDSRGQRVMGMLPARGLATTILTEKTEFVLPVPKKWSLKEAATVPVCYFTSYYALFVRGSLKHDEGVLIHAGCGGVGLASISIALHAGCKVFTTVGSKEKREFLKRTFPQLTDNCIGNSRDTSFEQMIMRETNGEGVDIILNSLAEDKLKASVRCLREGGRFLEIGKYDLNNDSPLGMSIFLKNISFHGIIIDELFKESYTVERKQVANLVLEGISKGVVKPLPSILFNEHQLEQAFRFMASGKHIGKVLIEIRNEEIFKNSPITTKKVLASSRTYFYPDKSYILVGGLGGFGMELAHWIISRGAKFIFLTSRNGIKTGYQSMWVRRWKKSGISVNISTEDVTNKDSCEKLIIEANKIAPIGGIFNLAGIIHDDLLENLDEQKFLTVRRPKVDGTRNLDIVSRRLCPTLEHFVVFSSGSSGRGLAGQINYGFANSAMDRLIEKRNNEGLPGLSIQWGPIGDVGMFIDIGASNDTVVNGSLPLRIYTCLNVLDTLLQYPDNFAPIVSCFVNQDKLRLMKNDEFGIVDVIGNILGIKDVKTVDHKSTFVDLGLDSLITSEIKQTLERKYDINMTVSEVRSLTFERLKEIDDEDKKTIEITKTSETRQ